MAEQADLESYRNAGYIVSAKDIVEGGVYCMEFEVPLIEARMESVGLAIQDVAVDISAAMDQSSETWHDNAPADAAFAHLNKLDQDKHRLTIAQRRLVQLPYPTPDMGIVTVGSLITCEMKDDEFGLLIVGNAPVHHPHDYEGNDIASLVAPIPRALLGLEVGDETNFTVGDRVQSVAVRAIDQTVIHTFAQAQCI